MFPLQRSILEHKMVSSRSIQQQTEGESTNQIVVNNENQNQVKKVDEKIKLTFF